MGKMFTKLNSWFTVALLAIAVNFAFARGVAAQKTDTSIIKILRSKTNNKPSYFNSSLHLSLPPIKPAVISTTKVSVEKTRSVLSNDKLLSNVQIYPNPVQDVINVKYTISRPSFVNVKVMDVLGNDVLTLFSQRVDVGDQTIMYNTGGKLNRGFYFLRINVGTEVINKRISVW